MKKTYIDPAMDVIEIKASHQLLAGSEIATGSTPTDPSTSDSRFFDFDDDEEW